jgi:ribosomal protein S18 acetylase RimI-like enzyme
MKISAFQLLRVDVRVRKCRAASPLLHWRGFSCGIGKGKMVHIRELQKDDIPALAKLAAKTFTETFGHSFTPEELEKQIEETRSEPYFRSVTNGDTILVAIIDDELAGYVQLGDVNVDVQGVKPRPGDQAVNAIYIHSDYQGQGIGRALMDAAFEHPRFQKAENIFIDVWDENNPAVDFYLKYGFGIVGKCDVTVDGKVVGYDLALMRPRRRGTLLS